MTTADRRRRREAGFTPVLAVLVFAAFALAAGIVLTGQLALATSRGAQAQHGADAAALAGAQAVLDEIPTDVTPGFVVPSDIPELLGGGRCLQKGRVEATRLAGENGDTLTSYCYDAFRDEITADVSTGDGKARASATAATTFDAGSCELPTDFTPDKPTENPDKDADPSPQNTLIDCGITSLRVVYNPVDSRFHFVGLELALADVDPRLTK